MTTPHVLDQLPLWVEGDLPPLGQAEVERHLAECPSCQAAARDLTASQAWLREALASPFDAADRARLRGQVMAQLRAEAAAAPIPRLATRTRVLAACAASLLLAALVWRQQRSQAVPPVGPAGDPPAQAAATLPRGDLTPPAGQPPPLVPTLAKVRSLPRREPGASVPAGPARIEFQTADPTIRIIWLAQASPLSRPTPPSEEPS